MLQLAILMNKILAHRSTRKSSAGLLATPSPVEWATTQDTAVQAFTTLAWVIEYTQRNPLQASLELAAATERLYNDMQQMPYLLLAGYLTNPDLDVQDCIR